MNIFGYHRINKFNKVGITRVQGKGGSKTPRSSQPNQDQRNTPYYSTLFLKGKGKGNNYLNQLG